MRGRGEFCKLKGGSIHVPVLAYFVARFRSRVDALTVVGVDPSVARVTRKLNSDFNLSYYCMPHPVTVI